MIEGVIGQTLVLIATLAALTGIVSGVRGGLRPAGRAWTVSQRSSYVLFGCGLAACVVLAIAMARNDFALSYVTGRINRTLPLRYKFTAVWAGQEGSLLFWMTVLGGYTSVLAWRERRLDVASRSWANTILLTIASFFAVLVTFISRPFAVAPHLAADGAGMPASLQNYWMAIHPPTLYLGYIGVAVPFAIVIGAMISGRQDDSWVRSTRVWALIAWLALTAGLTFGARWAYEEIGWGGYWAWDPVENAALMPWIATTAFLHSIMVQERRGMMRYWNVVLCVLAFGLSVFGTFLTRSGVLSSVHSFVSSSIGYWFLGFLAVAVAFSMAVLFWRRGSLRARHDLDSVVSRETTFLFNNLLLVALAVAILWGVVYPLLSAGLGGEKVSLQAPYYNFFLVLFGLPLLILMALGPMIPWRRASIRKLGRAVLLPGALALLAGALMELTGHGDPWAGAAAISFAIFVLTSIALEFRRGVMARRRAISVSRTRAFFQLFTRNNRRYGGYLSHAGIGLLVIAITGSTAYTNAHERTLRPGQTVRVSGYSLTYTGIQRTVTANAMKVRASFAIHGSDGRSLGTMQSGRDYFPASQEDNNAVGIHPLWRTGSDLYVIVNQVDDSGVANIKVIVNPLVNLLWLAIAVIFGGGLIAALPLGRLGGAARTSRSDTDAGVYESGDLPALRNGAPARGELLPGLRAAAGPRAQRDPV